MVLFNPTIATTTITTTTQTRAADASSLPDVLSVLDDLAAAGINVIRTWAFCDGHTQWSSLQPYPGILDERVATALDRVVYEIGERQMKCLLVLTNYWPDYGGMRQYVEWSKGMASIARDNDRNTEASFFYQDAHCQAMYTNFIAKIIGRINTITHVPYVQDPTIIGWSPANEPQCRLHVNANGRVIAQWAHRVASYIKQLDPNHLVFMDCEGFWKESSTATTTQKPTNPYPCGFTGCDFVSDCSSPAIDVACFHLYPDLWFPRTTSEERKLEFSLEWIRQHVEVAVNVLHKPIVLSEFGKQTSSMGTVPQPSKLSTRRVYYQRIFDEAEKHQAGAGWGWVGTMFWTAAAQSYPNYDGFTVYLSENTIAGAGDGTAAVVRVHARKMLGGAA